jgi:hypothetical protein
MHDRYVGLVQNLRVNVVAYDYTGYGASQGYVNSRTLNTVHPCYINCMSMAALATRSSHSMLCCSASSKRTLA